MALAATRDVFRLCSLQTGPCLGPAPRRLTLALPSSCSSSPSSWGCQAPRQARVVPRPASAVAVASAEAPLKGADPEWAASDFIVLGLAQCYVKDEDNKLQPVQVIEPIPAGALECMDNGGATSYLFATGTTLGVALQENAALLPPEFHEARFADEFEFRTRCAARTWKRQHAQDYIMGLLPVGAVRSDFNFSTEDKRVLNLETVVTDDDNIKQDLSIDVYGRSKDEEQDSQEGEIQKLYNA